MWHDEEMDMLKQIKDILLTNGVPQLVARVEVRPPFCIDATSLYRWPHSSRPSQRGEKGVKNNSRPSSNPDVFLSYRVVETGEGGDGSVFHLREALENVGYSVFVGEQDLAVRCSLQARIRNTATHVSSPPTG